MQDFHELRSQAEVVNLGRMDGDFFPVNNACQGNVNHQEK